jgi:hypothetical protein
MAENLDITDIKTVKHLISDIEGSEDKARKTAQFDAWEVYSGNVYPYVLNRIQDVRPRSFQGYTISDVSFSRVITDAKSKAYKEQPLRRISGVEKEDVKNDRLQEIYKEGDAIRQMPFFDTITNLHKHSLLWVNNLDDTDTYQFMSLQGYEYSVVRDKQTGELTGVILNYGNLDITDNAGGDNRDGNLSLATSGDGIDNLIAESQADSSAQSKVYAMWSKDNYVLVRVESSVVETLAGKKVEKSVSFIDQPENPKQENVIHTIPFVFMSQEMAIDYPTLSPLKAQTITANQQLSELMTASNIQGSGQLVFKYPEKFENKFNKITTGLLSAVKLPQSENPDDKATDADYISPSPDLAGMQEVALAYIKQVLNEHGLKNTSAIGSEGQDFNSGLQMAIANASTQDIIEQNQAAYVQIEREMFEIIKAWETFRGNSVFKEDDEIDVVFKKPKVLISDAEVLANIEKRLNLGLLEKWEALRILDPNLSEDAAREKSKVIMKSNVDNVKSLMPPTGAFNGNKPKENI